MTCKQSEKCDNADICKYAKSNAYNILGGSCYRPKEPLTNEEWLRQANTEQLAEEIVKMTLLDVYKLYDQMESAEYEHGIGIGAKKVIVEWLKQPHSEVGK